MEEIWKPVVGYPDYLVSNYGRVFGIKRQAYLRLNMANKGYVSVQMGHKKPTQLVHRMVLIAFVGFELGRPWVNHKNGIRCDNRLENLEWSTASENIRHKINVLGQGRLDTHPRARFSNEEVILIRKRLQSGESERALAKEYGVAHSTIHAIRSRTNWKGL